MKRIDPRTERTTAHVCTVCKPEYKSRDEAERCASPRELEYEVGQWVQYGRFVGRIGKISDENKAWGLDSFHPETVYLFDKGELIGYRLRESSLKEIDDSTIERLLEERRKKQMEADNLKGILDALLPT